MLATHATPVHTGSPTRTQDGPMVADPSLVALLFALLLSSPATDRFAVELLDAERAAVTHMEVARADKGFDLKLGTGASASRAKLRPAKGGAGRWGLTFVGARMGPLPIDLSASLKGAVPLSRRAVATGQVRGAKFTVRRSQGATYVFVPGKGRYAVVRAAPGPKQAGHAGCPVRLEATVNGGAKATTRGKPVKLQVWAANPSHQPVRLVVPNRCPSGPATFAGLEGRDVYDACVAGACAKAPATRTVVVPAKGRVLLTTGRVSPLGTSCNKPLKPGTYKVSASVAVAGRTPVACRSAAVSVTVRRRR